MNLLSNIPIVELIAGLGYLGGHILLARKQTVGWLVKILGGIGWVLFLYLNANYIFMANTAVVVLLMCYGLYKWHQGRLNEHTAIDSGFETLAGATALIVGALLIVSGQYTFGPFIETLIVIAELLGTVFLAQGKILGWYSYTAMSLFVIYLVAFVNESSAPILALLELASIYFYIQGIRRFSPSASSKA